MSETTRHAYGVALKECGENPKVVAIDADLRCCSMSGFFADKYPDRAYNAGIAEANMVNVAAGMATCGYIPFVHTFAMFGAGRGFEQIRNTVAYPELNVKIVGSYAGITVGEDGATHQCLEDMGILRTIPGMTVICPADGNETRAATHAMAETYGPMYMRLARNAVDVVTEFPEYKFELGKAVTMRDGSDVTIIACGIMVIKAQDAAELLASKGISARVLNMHTIKPIDRDAIVKAARETGAIVTAEEHNVLGGLGAAVAEVVTETVPVPVLKIGTQDVFGKSGDSDALLEMYGLTSVNIAEKAREAIRRKQV